MDGTIDDDLPQNNTWIFVMIPVITIFIACTILGIVCIRRRQKRAAAQSVDIERGNAGGGNSQSYRLSRRRTQPAQEGLNELGEAPPPYPGKDDSDTEEDEDTERRPPSYPAPPEPTLTLARRTSTL
ncbi:hypothetical protein S40285_07131 [Stachybotrys chlorohalonatus IBT 40285]|uniref:Uncharacterized protein n=1 Tax=Stachybotrys chlorohalonatus (strain IBT 40285) TaxID=1283841 RepID=A0A084QL48_STAC4|nr:hypothetical protein S40285_07131 [Stachybotrys chlorohalonata IBT 40285]